MASKEIETFLEIADVHKSWIDRMVSMSAWGQPEALYATAAMALKIICSGIKGAFCECGVGAGAHPAVMHYCQRFCITDRAKFRKVWMFDSFAGIPKATVEDVPSDDHPGDDVRKAIGYTMATPGLMESTGVTVVSMDEVKVRMERWGAHPDDMMYVEGWFENTVPVTSTGPLSLLRLDGDLYSGTKVCLEHLYPRVVRGGFVIVDDWILAGARRAVEEYFGDDMPSITEVPGPAPRPVFWRKR